MLTVLGNIMKMCTRLQEHKGGYKSELDYGKESVTERMVLTLSLTIAGHLRKEDKNTKEGNDHVRKRI